MEGIIFWLMPVALLVVLILVVLSQLQQPQRRTLLFCEPLGSLISRWRLVRVVGSELRLRQLLSAFFATKLNDGSSIELVLDLFEAPNTVEATLIESRPLPTLGEQRIVRFLGQTTSVLIGSPGAVLKNCRYRSDGRTLLTDSDRAEHVLTAERAGRHGYLVLLLAERAVHTKVIEPDRHTLLGLIFLEPILNERALNFLQSVPLSRQKLVSVLPQCFLEFLLTKISDRPINAPLITGSTSPAEREAYWQSANCLGEQSLDDKHAIARYFEHRRSCRLMSGLPSDRALPLPVRLF